MEKQSREITPAQQKELEDILIIAKANVRTILLEHVFLLVILIVINYFIAKHISNEFSKFMLFYLTGIVVMSSNSKALKENDNDLKVEFLKILDK